MNLSQQAAQDIGRDRCGHGSITGRALLNVSLLIVTPAGPRSKSGNRTTAVRWQRLLEGLGAAVKVTTAYAGERTDALIALHAYHSAHDVQAFQREHPDAPVIVALTGTDINEFLASHRAATLATINAANALVGLHDRIAPLLPPRARDKLHVIHQSAAPPSGPRKPVQSTCHVCVVGHLREVKDSMRTARAVRDLPPDSRIQVTHLGAAHDAAWERIAMEEMTANRRYRWLGEQPPWRVRREFQRTRAMVLSSRSEGGANVIGEALVAGVPVLASRISGNIGLLGEGYAGYFEVAATEELRALLLRVESDPAFVARLESQCAVRAPLFDVATERVRWRRLLVHLLADTTSSNRSEAHGE